MAEHSELDHGVGRFWALDSRNHFSYRVSNRGVNALYVLSNFELLLLFFGGGGGGVTIL